MSLRLGVLQEKVAVEIQGDVVAAVRRNGGEVVLQGLGVERHGRTSGTHDGGPQGRQGFDDRTDGLLVGTGRLQRGAEMTDHLVERGVGDVEPGMRLGHVLPGVGLRSPGGGHQHVGLMPAQRDHVDPAEIRRQIGIGNDPLVKGVDRSPDPFLGAQGLIKSLRRTRHGRLSSWQQRMLAGE